jgi:hypothetical protein
MLNMIRHGASKIFAGEGKDSLNTELDIDEVLKAGEKKTEELTAEYDSKRLTFVFVESNYFFRDW